MTISSSSSSKKLALDIPRQTLLQGLSAIEGLACDTLGEAIAVLNLQLNTWPAQSLFNIAPITNLAAQLGQPALLLAPQREALCAEIALTAEHSGISPLRDVIASLAFWRDDINKRPEPEARRIAEQLDVIHQHYQTYLNSLCQADKAQRITLLEVKAQLADDKGRFYLVEQPLARSLLGIDYYGTRCKENAFGNHPVVARGGIHFKPNPVGHNYIAPGVEYSLHRFYQTFFGEGLAPSALLKLSHVETHTVNLQHPGYALIKDQVLNGQRLEDLLQPSLRQAHPELEAMHQAAQLKPSYQSRTLQASLTIEGFLLHELLGLIADVDFLQTRLTRFGLEQRLDYWFSEGILTDFYETYPILKDDRSPEAFLQVIQKLQSALPPDEQLTDFSESMGYYIVDSAKHLNKIKMLLNKTAVSDLILLLAWLHSCPSLMAGSLWQLSVIPEHLRLLPKLFPEVAPKNWLQALDNLLNKFDTHNISAHVLGSMLTRPGDGKSDNYMVTLTRDNEGRIEKLRLVGIDNEPVFQSEAHFVPTQPLLDIAEGTLPAMRSILFCVDAFMMRPLDEALRKKLIESNPEQLLFDWVLQLSEQNQRYHELQQQGIITLADKLDNGLADAEHLALDIPLQLKPGTLALMLKQLRELHALMQKPVTHAQLFQALYPLLATYYQRLRTLYPQPADALSHAYHHPFTTIEAALQTELAPNHPDSTRFRQALEVFKEKALQDISHAQATQSLAEAIEELSTNVNVNDKPAKFQAQWWGPLATIHPHIVVLPNDIKKRTLLLHEAIRQGHAALVERLLLTQLAINYTDDTGQTALILAVKTLCSDSQLALALTQLILATPNVAVNHQDDIGFTALHHIERYAFHDKAVAQELIRLLVAHHANLEAVDKPVDGKTILDKAIRHEDIELVKHLVQLGAGRNLLVEPTLAFIRKHQTSDMAPIIASIKQNSPAIAWHLTWQALSQSEPSAITLHGIRTKQVNLSKEATHLFDGKRLRLKGSIDYGRRAVTELRHQGYAIHFKENPEMPGVEYAVGSLLHALIGHGAPYTELFKFTDHHKQPHALLASQTIHGRNLQDVFNETTEHTLINHLEPKYLSELLIATMLINPEDGKPDNYVLEKIQDKQGATCYRLVGVDNDHAFVEPFIKRQGQTHMQIKSILFCLDAMKEPLHPGAIATFRNIHPERLIRNWLEDLSEQHKRYQALFGPTDQRLLFKRERDKPIIIPMPFKPGIVAELYQKLIKLQWLLKTQTNLTPIALLKALMPSVAAIYEPILQKPLSANQRFTELFKLQYSTALAGRFSTIVNGRSALKSMGIAKQVMADAKEQYTPQEALDELNLICQQRTQLKQVRTDLQAGNIDSFKKLLTDSFKTLVVNGKDGVLPPIDFTTMVNAEGKPDKACQLRVLKAISQGSYQALRLHQVAYLTNDGLKTLLANSPDLRRLELVACPELTSEALAYIVASCPRLERLTLRNLTRLKDFTGSFYTSLSLVNLQQLVLTDCASLTHINLDAPQLTHLNLKGSSALNKLELRAPLLKNLNVKNNRVLFAKPLLKALKPAQVTHINLSGCKLINNEDLSDLVSQQSSIQQLVIDKCPLINYGQLKMTYPSLAGVPLELLDKVYVPLTKSLQEGSANLLLNDMSLTSKSLGALMPILTRACITHLEMSRNKLDKTAAPFLQHLLQLNTPLASLSLGQNQLGPTGAKALARGLYQNERLSQLHLECNQLGNKGAEAIGNMLAVNIKLDELRLWQNNISDEGVTALAKGLRHNLVLAQLSLWQNSISPAGAKALSEALSVNQRLHKLDLGDNTIGTAGVEALIASMGNNQSLQMLSLNNNQLSAESGETLAAWLSRHPLTGLYLDDNQLGDTGISALATGLADNTTLTHLSIKGNGITDSGGQALLNLLEKNITLLQLELDGNPCSSALQKAIEVKLKANRKRLEEAEESEAQQADRQQVHKGAKQDLLQSFSRNQAFFASLRATPLAAALVSIKPQLGKNINPLPAHMPGAFNKVPLGENAALQASVNAGQVIDKDARIAELERQLNISETESKAVKRERDAFRRQVESLTKEMQALQTRFDGLSSLLAEMNINATTSTGEPSYVDKPRSSSMADQLQQFGTWVKPRRSAKEGVQSKQQELNK